MRASEQLIDLDLAVPREKLATRLYSAVVVSVASAWRIAKNRHALNRLSDLDETRLNDIGLSRSDVLAIQRTTAFHEDPTQRLRMARNRAQKPLHR
jgi:uncharacterized protein YjiS (DUF1127 family)